MVSLVVYYVTSLPTVLMGITWRVSSRPTSKSMTKANKEAELVTSIKSICHMNITKTQTNNYVDYKCSKA